MTARTVFQHGHLELVWNDEGHPGGYLYLVAGKIQDGQVARTDLLAPGVLADFDPDGNLLGIEHNLYDVTEEGADLDVAVREIGAGGERSEMEGEWPPEATRKAADGRSEAG